MEGLELAVFSCLFRLVHFSLVQVQKWYGCIVKKRPGGLYDNSRALHRVVDMHLDPSRWFRMQGLLTPPLRRQPLVQVLPLESVSVDESRHFGPLSG